MLDIDNNILQNKKYIFKIDYIGGGKNKKNNKKPLEKQRQEERRQEAEQRKREIEEEKIQREQKLQEEKNKIIEELDTNNQLFDKNFNKYKTIKKINNNLISTALGREEKSFAFENPNDSVNYQLDKIHYYKNKFCKFFLFENLKKKYEEFKKSLKYYLQNYGFYAVEEYNTLEKLKDYHPDRNNTYSNDDSKFYRIKTLNEYNIDNIINHPNHLKYHFFTNYFSKLSKEQYEFYLGILKNLLDNKTLDENYEFVIKIMDDIKLDTEERKPKKTHFYEIKQVFSIIKVFESIIFFYESVRDINNFYKFDKANLLNILTNPIYNTLKENFETNEFKKMNDIIINGSLIEPNNSVVDLNNIEAVQIYKKKEILKKIFTHLYNYSTDIFNFEEFTEIHNDNLINEIKQFPHKFFVYKTGKYNGKCRFNLAKIELQNPSHEEKEINHFLKYGIYKDTFTLNNKNQIVIKKIIWPNNKFSYCVLEVDTRNNILTITDRFARFYPLYEISNTGCNNNNFYLHYFDYGQNTFNSLSFHFNIFLNNYRFHLKNWKPDTAETFYQSKIIIDETHKNFIVSNITQYDPSTKRANEWMKENISNLNFRNLDDNNINNNDGIYIEVLKIFQEIMFQRYDFNGIKYEFVIFDKTIKIDNNNNNGPDHEYRIIKYSDGTRYLLSTQEPPNDDYFKYLERYDK